MAKELLEDIRALSLEDLKERLATAEKDYGQLVFDNTAKGIEDPMQIRTDRRNIARMKTVLRQKELEEMGEEAVIKRRKIRARRRKS